MFPTILFVYMCVCVHTRTHMHAHACIRMYVIWIPSPCKILSFTEIPSFLMRSGNNANLTSYIYPMLQNIHIHTHTHTYIQRYFCDGTHWDAVQEVLSQKDSSRNAVVEPFFPGINITNTFTSANKFWVTMHFRTYFL
jgi:hypothetical protein